MNSSTLNESAFVDLEAGAAGARPNRRRWWRALTRAGRPRRMGRRAMMEKMHADHLRLVATLDRISERLDGAPGSRTEEETEPVPVFEGIRIITAGQERIGGTLDTIQSQLERSFETDSRLTEAVDKIDRTLGEVHQGHADVAGALERVRERIEESSQRLEEAEQWRIEEFRRLKNRLLAGAGLIAACTVGGIALLLHAPWG